MIFNINLIAERQNQETLPVLSHLADFIDKMPLNKNLSLIVELYVAI
jgi:hypothetical protein